MYRVDFDLTESNLHMLEVKINIINKLVRDGMSLEQVCENQGFTLEDYEKCSKYVEENRHLLREVKEFDEESFFNKFRR